MGPERPLAPLSHMEHTMSRALDHRPDAESSVEVPAPAHRERGASAVEYGLLISGIAAVIALVVYAFGGGVGDLFQTTCDTLQASRGTTC